METKAGTQLTEEEIKLIKKLRSLAILWRKNTDRLWLFSGSGDLTVMMYEDETTNKVPEHTVFGGVNPDNVVEGGSINIPNDGGDW